MGAGAIAQHPHMCFIHCSVRFSLLFGELDLGNFAPKFRQLSRHISRQPTLTTEICPTSLGSLPQESGQRCLAAWLCVRIVFVVSGFTWRVVLFVGVGGLGIVFVGYASDCVCWFRVVFVVDCLFVCWLVCVCWFCIGVFVVGFGVCLLFVCWHRIVFVGFASDYVDWLWRLVVYTCKVYLLRI